MPPMKPSFWTMETGCRGLLGGYKGLPGRESIPESWPETTARKDKTRHKSGEVEGSIFRA